MSKNRYWPYSLGLIALLALSYATPTFAEVTSLQTNSESFYKGDQIEFSGNVEKGSNGLVTIVIRNLNDEFVMLSQAVINSDDSFEKTIKINEKFSEHGVYNATGFILNMTKGITTNFGVSLNGVPVITNDEENTGITEESPQSIDDNDDDKSKTSKESSTVKKNFEKEIETSVTNRITDFVDPTKEPRHYVDRYYNEPNYASWFDRNYPELTIEEAVGYTDDVREVRSTVEELINNEIILQAQASSIVEPSQASSIVEPSQASSIVEPSQEFSDNSEIAQMSLAIGGLVILFGAVYGVKKKVDNNSKQISINRNTIRKKLIQPIIGSNPREILQTRLAKGEITLEEYEKLISKLN